MSMQNHLLDNINTYSFQSFCIFILNVILLQEHLSKHLLVSAIIVLVFKVIGFPLLLRRVVKKLHVQEQFENIINIQLIFILIGILTAISFLIFPYEELSFLGAKTCHVMPLALSICFIGLMLMINRVTTISQVLGFLVMENGITLMVLFGANSFSSVLEFGLALDLLIGIIIMGIFSNRIKRDLEHINVRKLSQLKDIET
jgi:hydrogenase-4 membrane subunit HyfE